MSGVYRFETQKCCVFARFSQRRRPLVAGSCLMRAISRSNQLAFREKILTVLAVSFMSNLLVYKIFLGLRQPRKYLYSKIYGIVTVILCSVPIVFAIHNKIIQHQCLYPGLCHQHFIHLERIYSPHLGDTK